MTEQRPVIISCDGHATGRPADYVPYIEPAYREQYDEFVRVLEAARIAREQATEEDRSLFSKAGSEAFKAETGNARDGEWNSPLRTEVLEGEGVVAEVLFPNAGVPFGGFGESATTSCAARATVRTTAGCSTSPTTRPAGVPRWRCSPCTTSTRPWPRSSGHVRTGCAA